MRYRPGCGGLVRAAGILAFTLAAVSCARSPTPEPPRAMVRDQPVREQRPPPAVDPQVLTDQRAIAAAQRALDQLGYDVGKADGIAGPSTRRTIMAFQKDHALTEDGRLTFTLAESLKTLSEAASLSVAAGDTLIYSDGVTEVAATERAVQWDQPDGRRSLVAIRPATTSWPAAARAGLDWATTHALDLPAAGPPVEWSSTGVGQHFEIRTSPALSPRETSLVGAAALSCRHFELRSDEPQRRYPGIACKDAKGAWSIPRSRIRLARPATGLGPQTASDSLSHLAN